MIKLMKTAGEPIEAKGAILFNCGVHAIKVSEDAAGRPANHNLTREARRSNVVLLGGSYDDPDFRPDLGARIAMAA